MNAEISVKILAQIGDEQPIQIGTMSVPIRLEYVPEEAAIRCRPTLSTVVRGQLTDAQIAAIRAERITGNLRDEQ